MSLQLGLQLFTVRNYLRDDLEAGLKRFGDMGFKNVEFPSYDPEALSGEKPRIRNVTSQEMNEMHGTSGDAYDLLFGFRCQTMFLRHLTAISTGMRRQNMRWKSIVPARPSR